MNNEDVLIKALSSVDYTTAKNAIKGFYRAVLKERAQLQELVERIAADYVIGEHKKTPPVVGVTTFTYLEKEVAGTEKLSDYVCPKCGESIEYSLVCPSCAVGRAGYIHRYSCVCGVTFVTKEKL